jgi:peptide/nickel transport system permease protein
MFGVPGTVKQLVAGYQVTAVVLMDGTVYTWGNENMTDIHIKPEYQGQIEKVTFTSDAMIALLKDGSVKYVGIHNNIYSRIPEGLSEGVVDIASTYTSVAALKSDGSVVVWGNTIRGERNIPQTDAKIVKLFAGQYHYTAFWETAKSLPGEIICLSKARFQAL